MKMDNRSWGNATRLRMISGNLARMLASICAVNGFYALIQRNWIIMGINILFFITAIITIISKSKYDKENP